MRIPGYMTASEAAERWGYADAVSIGVYLRSGRVPGAFKRDGKWYIPEWLSRDDIKPSGESSAPPELAVVDPETYALYKSFALLQQVPMFRFRQALWDALAELSPRERYVFVRRYGLSGLKAATLDELSAELCVTRERVLQIGLGAIKRLREHMPGEFVKGEKEGAA